MYENVGRLLRQAGLEGPAAKVFYRLNPPINDGLLSDLGAIEFKEIDFPHEASRNVVLFPEFYSRNFRTVFHGLLAHGLAERGLKPLFVFGDRSFDACQGNTTTFEDPCVECTNRSRIICEEMNLPHLYIDEIEIDDIDDKIPSDALESYARSSAINFFSCARLDAEQEYKVDEYKDTGRRAWNITRQIDETYGVSRVMTTGSPYLPRGMVIEYARENGIPITVAGDPVYGDGKSLIFGKMDGPLSQYMSDDAWEKWLTQGLSDEQEHELAEFMKERFSGHEYTKYSDEGNGSDIANQSKTTFSLFSHLPWDAAIADISRAYPNQYSWILSTIEYISHRADSELIIKTHPAEEIIGTNEGVADVIFEERNNLPENVTLLSPDTDRNPYSIIDDSDAVLVFGSTVGMEAAYLGEPVITAGNAHYSQKGFTLDPDTEDEYKSALEAVINGKVNKPDERKIKCYLYSYFIGRPVKPPFLDWRSDSNRPRITRIQKGEEFSGNSDEEFVAIVDAIVNDTDYAYTRGL